MEKTLEVVIWIMFALFFVSIVVNAILVLKEKIDHWGYTALFAITTTLLCIVMLLIQQNG